MLSDITFDILNKSLSNEQLFQKHIVQGKTWFFENISKDKDQEVLLKSDFAERLNVNINDTYIVGSAKTGFSLKPTEMGGSFDRKYNKSKIQGDKSDIDIAIVSEDCFEYFCEKLFLFTKHFNTTWDRNEYYDNGSKKFGVSLNYMCTKYLARGWLRPDLLPQDFQLGIVNELKNRWRKNLSRKVSCGIYKNWYYFKSYQVECIENLRVSVSGGKHL